MNAPQIDKRLHMNSSVIKGLVMSTRSLINLTKSVNTWNFRKKKLISREKAVGFELMASHSTATLANGT